VGTTVQSRSIAIACQSNLPEKRREAHQLAPALKLPLINADTEDGKAPDFLLIITDDRLELASSKGRLRPIYVDFCGHQATYRRLKGGGKSQLIAKAVGIKNHATPTVIDATAGLGTDGFTLAGLGCHVTMIERSAIISALLADGLKRLRQMTIQPALNLSLIACDTAAYLNTLTAESFPDVIYLDPMFPIKTKNALAKKEMRILRAVVGDDADAEVLFRIACRCAKKRVVVKRHWFAPALSERSPDLVFKGKSCRFDVYFKEKTL